MSTEKTVAELGLSTTDFIEILHQHHIVIGESPVLGSFDAEGSDGETLHFSWEAEDPVDGGSVSVPHQNIPGAIVQEGSIWLNDDSGDEVQLSIYPAVPVRLEAFAKA